jgi:hypothetical protein
VRKSEPCRDARTQAEGVIVEPAQVRNPVIHWRVEMADIQAGSRNGIGQRQHRMPRIPPNLFSITFGLAGLGQAWDAARPVGSARCDLRPIRGRLAGSGRRDGHVRLHRRARPGGHLPGGEDCFTASTRHQRPTTSASNHSRFSRLAGRPRRDIKGLFPETIPLCHRGRGGHLVRRSAGDGVEIGDGCADPGGGRR